MLADGGDVGISYSNEGGTHSTFRRWPDVEQILAANKDMLDLLGRQHVWQRNLIAKATDGKNVEVPARIHWAC